MEELDKQIIEKLKTIIEPYLDDFDIDKTLPSSHLINDLGLDSFYVIDIVMDIENEFEIQIENEKISQFEYVQNVIDIVKEKIK
jgi:acyl carrier protein